MGIIDETARRAGTIAGGALRAGQGIAGQVTGRVQRLRGGSKDLSNQELARKVESIIFRGDDVAKVDKGKIDINAVDGEVWLRGVAPNPAAINALEEATRAIPEVREVHNLLHLPKTPAPSRTDTPPSQRKTRRSGTRSKPRTEPRRVNADKTARAGGEQPEKQAAQRKGRQPAKLGSKDA
ncbi:MAG TPA: BON domain-containing protein [Solirubrobacteraceae bacterium]|nr:BON domain-containing protein [Solirubrobacteraceae bacterium]